MQMNKSNLAFNLLENSYVNKPINKILIKLCNASNIKFVLLVKIDKLKEIENFLKSIIGFNNIGIRKI